MSSMIKRVLFAAIILTILPLVVLAMGWHWQPTGSSSFFYLLYLVTETASNPWAILTCLVFAAVFTLLLRVSGRKALLLISVLGVAILSGQVIKSVLKNTFEEPRPYVTWLESRYHIDDDYFYSLPRSERTTLVHDTLKNDKQIPQWLKQHWEHETGYAFPSGHTMFAATWALLAILFLWPRGYYITASLFLAWALTVAASRLLLGMHWPADLILSTTISTALVIGVGWFCQRFKLLFQQKTTNTINK